MAWTHVGELAAMIPNKGRVVVVERRRIALFLVDGVVRAIDDACPHRGGPLSEGEIVGGAVECPIHGWAFDVCTGVMRGTQGVRVGRYDVEVREGGIWIDVPA